jgi:hypothetical protein
MCFNRKKTGACAVFRAALIFLVAALLLTMPTHTIEAVAAPSGPVDFEIPMNQLSSETKAAPVKRAAEKRKKSAVKARRARTVVKSSRTAPKKVATVAAPQQAPLTMAEPMQPYRIFTVPYSFVVIGKSTVIKAVIYREASDLQSVSCKIREAETGALTVVRMTKMDGLRFTYSATLPEVAAAASSLRYTIAAIDTSDTTSVSQEFMTPVASSPLVPGWQF